MWLLHGLAMRLYVQSVYSEAVLHCKCERFLRAGLWMSSLGHPGAVRAICRSRHASGLWVACEKAEVAPIVLIPLTLLAVLVSTSVVSGYVSLGCLAV